MPTDFVHYTSQQQDKTSDTEIETRIKHSRLIALTAPCMTWVCHAAGVLHNEVFSVDDVTNAPGPLGDRTGVGTLEEWVMEQPASQATEAKQLAEHNVVQQESGLAMILGTDNIARIYVPIGRREALIKMHHTAINHLAAAKTNSAIRRHYMWPTMRRDVRRYCEACTTCELSKARRNASSGTWRALQASPPRSRWGMDWYGAGDGNILGMIDLDSLWAEAEYSKEHTAKATSDAFRDKVLHQHGHPDELRSDHAREFVGKVMAMMAKQQGYNHTTTGGYSSTGNATVERFWGYIAVCLRTLTDEQYQHIEEHLQQMVWAWNTTVSESLGVSPFEVMTGRLPRTGPGSVIKRKLAQSTALNIPAIRTAAAEYAKVAAANADYNRAKNAEHLNSFGRKLRALAVGDKVKIYAPPGHAEAVRRMRKHKHMEQ